jgi:LysR family transcriptional regulator, hydrogen peroxide-inducible genes activator
MTLLPYLAVQDTHNGCKQNLIRKFNSPVPKREIGLVFSKALSKTHLVEALAEEIVQSLPKILLEPEESLIVT